MASRRPGWVIPLIVVVSAAVIVAGLVATVAVGGRVF
ncbi:hypothetical protein Lxx06090 [Leifsonia xyli subsp. xyli str. CTCB07]|uniref:Uncharacterized protein n=1 Tax=Leifsonia xyli subsp. xyli (strain CTCB07) TaxID=281090 RepID=Q6AGC7_LEIXX|nr:hypothetical protein Lxx06090 [Leifsonia xyli subsp. xyli str. CTCB07]